MSESLIATAPTETAVNDQITDAVTQTEAPARPEWLPEKFLVNNEPAYENLAKSYGELEKTYRAKEEDLRAKLIDELAAEAYQGRPEAPEKYELPTIEGADVGVMAEHPLTKWWAEFAFENGFDQETFKSGIEMYLQARAQDVPNPEQELKALGDNAKARTEAVGLWVGQNFDESEIGVIEQICTTAQGVKVMEKLMQMVRGEAGSDDVFVPMEQVTEADINKMMQDRRYWSPTDRDPTYIKKVESYFQKKYGARA